MKSVRKCKVCGVTFHPVYSSLQATCSAPKCILIHSQKLASRKSKKELIDLKVRLKSVSQWRKELQQVFNRYIRERDKLKPCISCGKPLKGKFDAGHYLSVGSYPNLRFSEDNCFGQCVECNQHKHGNLIEYSIGILQRIGPARVDRLMEARNQPLRLSVEEIKDKISYYKSKIKSNEFNN
jgi:hypothetical protein